MPPETKPAITFGTPKVVTQQPCRPNDYEHDNLGLLQMITEVGPVATFLTLLIAGAYFAYVWFARVFLPVVLACVVLSSTAASAQRINHAMWFYHEEHPETVDQHHGLIFDLIIPINFRMYARTKDEFDRWSVWHWVDNIQHNIKPGRDETVAHSYHNRQTILTRVNLPPVAIQFAFAGGDDTDEFGQTLTPIECVTIGAWAWGVPDEIYLVMHTVMYGQVFSISEESVQSLPTAFLEMTDLSVVVTGP